MSEKSVEILLSYILDSIEKIELALRDVGRDDFLSAFTFQDIVDRRLEIIGEAAVYIPREFKEAHPEIEWVEIIATRNKIIHEYFSVDHKLVWEIIKKDIPRLKKQILEILNSQT